MNHLAAFFNTRLEDQRFYPFKDKTSYLENAGNFLLSPVRYLADGRNYTVVRTPESQYTQFERLVGHEYSNYGPIYQEFMTFMDDVDDFPPRIKKCIRTIVAIIAFVPAILAGTLVKGLALLNANARDRHYIAAQNRIVIDKKVIEKFETTQDLQDALNDPYRKRIKTLVIHGNGKPIGRKDIGFNLIDVTERIILKNTEFTNRVDATEFVVPWTDIQNILCCQNFERTEKGNNSPILTHHRVSSIDEAQNFPLSGKVKKVFIVEE